MTFRFFDHLQRKDILRMAKCNESALAGAGLTLLLSLAIDIAAHALPISYGGRLVEGSGAPREGQADIEINFYDAAENGSRLGSSPYSFPATPLSQGVFNVDLDLSDADVALIFKDPKAPVWIEVTDKGQNRVYPRQRFGVVPYALKVPVDGATLGFDEGGQLKVLTAPSAGNVPNPLPAVDGAALTNVDAATLRGSPVAAAVPSVGQVLKWDGSTWAPAADTDTDTANPGTVTSITAGSGLTGGTITGSGTLSLAATLPALDGSALTGVNAEKLQSVAVASAAPATSQVLKYDGTKWAPAADANSGGTVTSITAGSGLTGGTITGSGTLSLAATLPAVDGSALTGINAVTLQTVPVDTTAPAVSQVLKYDGAKWAPATDANSGGTVTSVTAGTGLTGGTITGSGTLALSSPMPALDGGALTNVSAVKIQGRTISSIAPANGQVLKWNASASTWEAAPDDGGVAGAISAGQNLGLSDATTADVYESTSAPNIRFRRLKEGMGVELTQNASDVTVGVATGGITATELAADSVESAAIAANAVGTAEIADDAVTSAKIAANAVGTAEIADDAVTSAKIAAGGVTSSEILDGTITGADVASGAAFSVASVDVASQAGVTLSPFGAAAGNTGEARFKELSASGSNFVAMKAPDSLAADVTYTLPSAAPTSNGQVLSGTTAGTLSWTSLPTALPPSGAASGDLTGSYPNPTLAASGVTAGTYPKVTVDAKGRVTGGSSTITATDIADGTIADADISGTAQVATSKLSGAVTSISGHGLGALATLSAVGSSQISDGSIADADISGTAQVSTSKLSGAVTSISGHGLGTLATLSSVASAQITDGSIVDADISGTAAIADSKLATISTAGKVSGAAITSGTIGGTAAFGGSGGVSTTGAITGTGNIIVNGTGAATTELHFSDNDNSNYVGFKAPGAITANRIWVLPAVDGGSGDLLKTDGAGNLSWISGSSPTGAAGGDLTGNFPNPTLSASGVTAGTYPKVAVDAKGRVIGGSSTITATDIADGTIADADISGTAQVATSKLSGAVTSISGHGLGALATLAAVGSSEISDGAVVDADISGTAAISSTKISFAADSISGNAIDGGIVSNFQSTGIDDDATGVAMTLTSSGNVGIGTATPQSALQVSGYMQLDTVSSPPPTTDCDAASEYGRMKVDPTSGSQRLFVCTAIGWSATALADASPAGESAYTTAGTYSFVVPSGVTSIAAVAVGGGGGGGGSPGGSGQSSGGGGGGALVWGNSIPVTPGETLTVVVGAGGAGGSSSGVAGGYSEIKRGATVLMRANGGAAGQQSAATAAGGAANIGGYPYNTGGGSGGAGGPGNAGNGGGGGGGAGGYSGNGGNGGYQATAATAGAGGGGGGGGESEAATSKPGGGGVGLLGLGTSGAAGAMDGGGGGGSSGQDGSATAAGTYGGGGGGVEDDTVGSGSAGARGAVRVIWGAGRSFPSNAN